jgi:protein-ribulosamine 3-kinase
VPPRRTVGGVTHPLLRPVIVHAVERAAAEHLGRPWRHAGFTDLNHRASHPCGVFAGSPFSVFAKLDVSPAGHDQFTAELNGLRLIRSVTGVTTPVPVAAGVVVTGAGSLLLTEALAPRGAAAGQAADYRTPEDYAAIGRTLAALHRVSGNQFGLAEFDGFFGSVPQSNRPVSPDSWAGFYAGRRVLPMLRLAADSGHLPAELKRGTERVVALLPELCGPDPVPSLLHGDAQQNNFVSTADGAAVTDVAPYYGHPEVDLAQVEIFSASPVDPALFRAYEQLVPVDPGFAWRRELWRVHGYLAAVAVAGASPFGRSFLPRLAAAVRQYT